MTWRGRTRSRFALAARSIAADFSATAQRMRPTTSSAAVFLTLLGFVIIGAYTVLRTNPSGSTIPETPWEAAYILVLLTGGTNPDLSASTLVQATHVSVALAAALLVPVVLAVVFQSIIDVRDMTISGRGVPPQRGHVIIAGLGRLGVAVATRLRHDRVPVVGIERDPSAKGILQARSLGVPVLIGDASDDDVLSRVDAHKARSLVSCVGADIDTTRILAAARHLNGSLPVIARTVGSPTAERTRNAAMGFVAYDVASVGAEYLAAAVTDERILDVIPHGSDLVFLYLVHVAANSALDGMTVGEARRFGLPLGVRTSTGTATWKPTGETRIDSGNDLLLAMGRGSLRATSEAARSAEQRQ